LYDEAKNAALTHDDLKIKGENHKFNAGFHANDTVNDLLNLKTRDFKMKGISNDQKDIVFDSEKSATSKIKHSNLESSGTK
jgi:hypothetical protein